MTIKSITKRSYDMVSHSEERIPAFITDVNGVANGGEVDSERPLIVGKADPFTTIDVYDGTTLLGVVSSNGQGGWSLQLSSPLDDGIHDLSAVQVTEYGVGSTSTYFAITVNAEQSAQFIRDKYALAADDARLLQDPVANGVPYFPANLFKAHNATANETAQDENVDRHSYVKQTATSADVSKTFETVAFQGDHLTLHLGAFSDRIAPTHLPAIGGFDLGGHHNALNVTIADVMELGKHNLFIDDGKQQLIVHGKEGDSVNLKNHHSHGLSDGHWQHHGTAQLGGVTYHVVDHSSANTELLIEQAIRIDMH
jgi:Bacterial Ig-like domain